MDAQSPQHEAFGRAIRELREELGVSQEELAHRAGMDRSYFGQVERGERNASLKNVFRIADALEVDVLVLFERYERRR